MKIVNETKRNNAAILLADGSKLTVAQSGLSFQELTGVLGRAVEQARQQRVRESASQCFSECNGCTTSSTTTITATRTSPNCQQM
jgi:hypothetical protein